MPDDTDLQRVAGLLPSPESWTAADADLMRAALDRQRDVVAACDPADEDGRQAMFMMVVALEAAVRRYEGNR